MKLLISLFMLFVLFSCGGEGGSSCDSNDLTNDTSDEYAKFEAAANAYGNDPSDSNCMAWKNAGDTYIRAVDNYIDGCDELTPAEYDQAVQGALAALAVLPCG